MSRASADVYKKSYIKNRDKILARAKHRYENDAEFRAIRNKRSLEWQRNNKEARSKIARRAQLKLKYGITIEQYESFLQEQGGACAICKTTDAKSTTQHGFFIVDHDHKTGDVRGILCERCNHLLGHARDNIETLRSAISYLEKNNG